MADSVGGTRIGESTSVEPQRVDPRAERWLDAQPREFVAQHSLIKGQIVGHEHRAVESFSKGSRNLPEPRTGRDHRCRHPVEPSGTDVTARIDEGVSFLDGLAVSVQADDRHLHHLGHSCLRPWSQRRSRQSGCLQPESSRRSHSRALVVVTRLASRKPLSSRSYRRLGRRYHHRSSAKTGGAFGSLRLRSTETSDEASSRRIQPSGVDSCGHTRPHPRQGGSQAAVFAPLTRVGPQWRAMTEEEWRAAVPDD